MLTADPSSVVNLLAVDQSVQLLKSGNDITTSTVNIIYPLTAECFHYSVWKLYITTSKVNGIYSHYQCCQSPSYRQNVKFLKIICKTDPSEIERTLSIRKRLGLIESVHEN